MPSESVGLIGQGFEAGVLNEGGHSAFVAAEHTHRARLVSDEAAALRTLRGPQNPGSSSRWGVYFFRPAPPDEVLALLGG